MTQTLRIGRYEAGEFVARDAHASVCRVVDPADGRTLTAKLYAATGGPDARLLSRWHDEFADEVRRLQRHGRDLVPLEDCGRAGDLAWVVMDIPPVNSWRPFSATSRSRRAWHFRSSVAWQPG